MNIYVPIGDIIGRDLEAKELWDFIKLKRNALVQCNVTKGTGRGLDAEVAICVARYNKSSIPISLRTAPRSQSYKVSHTQQYLHRKTKSVFDHALDEINEAVGENSELKEKIIRSYWIYVVD